ncbi:MAG: endonuclease domain-containing protein [Actinobacteria bacterium]|nr:endonuclease domain-containing protein [Actinomycetota bacterium]
MISRKRIIGMARELRKNSTPAEKMLWAELRNRQVNGIKFLRQHPLIYEEDRGRLHFFIADFYSAEHKLVIELDGKIHEKQKYYDRERDLIIEKLGLKVIRFKNKETVYMSQLIEKIKSYF